MCVCACVCVRERETGGGGGGEGGLIGVGRTDGVKVWVVSQMCHVNMYDH